MPRFFLDPSRSLEDKLFLDPQETHHAISVFRIKKGDPLDLLDGKGHRFRGVAGEVSNGRLSVRITEKTNTIFPSPVQVTLGVAVFRPERMEILIQKACELGAHAMIPFISERSLVNLSAERWEAKLKRWQKIIQESCKQCGLPFAPEISSPGLYKNFISNIKNYDLVLLSTLEGVTAPLAAALPLAPPRRVLVLVGPEGDFSPKEADLALRAGAKPVSLGPLVLRSETAGLYALSVLHFFYREVAVAK